MATKSQIINDSNLTYVPNTSGLITPQQVQTLNTNWINASIFPEDTGSMSVQNAATASFLLGSIASASYAATADSASQAANSNTIDIVADNGNNSHKVLFVNNLNAANAQTVNIDPTAGEFTYNPNTGLLTVTASLAVTSSRAVSALSASYATTSSLGVNNLTTASAVANILTFTKGDGSTFNVTVAQSGSVASASYADVANLANTATSASYAFTASSASNSFNAVTASFAISASRAISAATATSATTATSALTAISASQATNANNALTASFVAGVATLSGNNTFTGVTTFNNAVTMSNVLITNTASIQYLNVVFQSSSIIYSSGSNQLGDASNDTQTLWGTVNVISGPLVVTGSANFASVITGSIATALNANTASYVANAFISASQVGGNDKVSLTNAGGTTTTLTINNVASANSAASANTATSASYATNAGSANTATSASYALSASFATNSNTASFTPNAFVSASNYLTNDTIVLYKEGIGSNNVTINNVQSSSFADNANTANSATTATTATSASYAQLAATASYFQGLVASASYAILAETANTALTANTANSALTAINADTASFLNGNALSASYAATASVLLGTVTSASYALTSSGVQGINASTVNSTYYLGFVPNAEINALSIDTDLSYNPSTGILAATQFNGSLNGNATTATTATSASFAQTSVTASFATNFRNSGSYVITGSHRGNVVSQSIASSTASFDFSTGNFFTLNLTGSAVTHISASNIQAGQTVNVRITQGATTGSVSFSPAFDQVSGSAYVPTAVANAVDILTFITFDNSLIYVSNIKNLV